MGNETVDVVKMGVTFCMLAAAMIFVVFNIIWGQDMNRDFNARMDNTESQAMGKYFKQTNSTAGADMPVAAAYSLYEDNINDVDAVAIGRYSDNETRETKTGWFNATTDGNWRFSVQNGTISSNSSRIVDDPGAVKDSVVHFKKYKWNLINENGITYDGTNTHLSESWLKNNLYGRCNVRTAPTKNGTYVMVVSIYP